VAAPLIFRLAIALAPRVTRYVSSGQPPAGGAGLYVGAKLRERLEDPNESDADLTDAVAAASGTIAAVATYEETFETRKLQVLFGRTSGGSVPEDDAIITFHLLKLAGGVPEDEWIAGDFTAAEAAFDAFWTSVKVGYLGSTTLKQYRWYRAGPQRDDELGGPGRTGPPVRVVDKAVVGTAAGSPQAPPQVAISVTERTTDPSAWGRFYLPAPEADASQLAGTGRLAPAFQTIIANAADAMYEAWLLADTIAVVYSAAKAARQTKAGTSLPARAARALSVDTLQVDDLMDVIRSRRWRDPLLRLQRAVGS
jgi:hypothetical protein